MQQYTVFVWNIKGLSLILAQVVRSGVQYGHVRNCMV